MSEFRSIAAIFIALQALVTMLSATPEEADNAAFRLPQQTDAILGQYCYSCHDEDIQKGDTRLDDIATLDTRKRLDLLNRMQEQVFFRNMPPKNKRQPDDTERQAILSYLAGELARHHASTLEGKLEKPEFGNYVDHEKLFSGEYRALPGFTHDRRWLISEYIFNAKFQRMLEAKPSTKKYGKNVPVIGGSRIQDLSLTNPFLLPEISGVRYYANEDLTGGHLSTMLTNSQKTSEYITGYLAKRNPKFLPAINAIMALEDRQQATLAMRRQFLELFIARLCEDIYGGGNAKMLPTFIPVEINDLKELKEGEKYKRAPIHVAQNMLKGLQADTLVNQLLSDAKTAALPDDEFRELCERTWFHFGDHELKIQGRMTLLRDYLSDFRELGTKKGGKDKPFVYQPLDEPEMEIIRASILKHRKQGDFYNQIIEKCMADWKQGFEREIANAGPPSDELLSDLVGQLSEKILERPPTPSETTEYLIIAKSYAAKLGTLKAIQKLIQTFILSSEFVYRQEFGTGTPDESGRRMLSPRDASYAIAYALTDQSPDEELKAAAAGGRLQTRDDYKREVLRILGQRDKLCLIDPILADKQFHENTTRLPIRELRFFREFFGYPAALTIFKDEKRFGGDRLDDATARLVNETDRLVEHILEKDKNVFEDLLTTEEFYVYHDGDNERMQAASDRIKRIYDHFKDLDWKRFTKKDLVDHAEFLREVQMRGVDPDNLEARNRQGDTLQLFKLSMTSITARLDKGQKAAAPFDLYRGYGYDFMSGYHASKFFNFRLDDWDYETHQPAKVAHRKGMLTHPAWLIAHAKNTETDPVHRGKWVREKLLAGTIPDTPVTVDAVIPEDHDRTLRSRLAGATENSYCWKCHESMNPLGYVFESYDDFGRYRMEEFLEYPEKMVKKGPDKPTLLIESRDIYQTLPVDSSGHLKGTGDESLDGELKDAFDLADRLAKSTRVRQSIIRHAFRYFLGRNEQLSDSKTLMDADQAYVESGGSFDAVIVSLLTSDSFIYRKPLEN
ncbi:MAG: DUF1588 domain-containing protein [Luteolibacter sp.]